MKIHRDVLKSIVKECIDELLSEEEAPEVIAPDEDPKVKKLRRDVEIKKQAVEREKQKSLGDRLKDAQRKKSFAKDVESRKTVDAEIKTISDKKTASKAAQVAAVKSASSIK